MKKNIILSTILAGLLMMTYFLQEKRVEKEEQAKITKDRLINKPITHLEWNSIDAVKKSEQWFMGDSLLSHNFFKQLEKKLVSLKKVKETQGEWKSFFSEPVTFKLNGEQWTVGDMTLDQQGFYIGKNDLIYVARIEGESYQLTQDENEIERTKVNELKGFLGKSLDEIKETQLFRYYQNIPFELVQIESHDRPGFELNFLTNQTSPSPIPGIITHEHLRQKFLSLLTQVNLKLEVPYDSKLKLQSMGKITFFAQGKQSVIWEIWLRNKNSADVILVDDNMKKAYLMVGGTLKIFFVGLQDYWDKKVIPPKSFESFNSLEVQLRQGQKSARVIVYNREPLSFESTGHKVVELKMQELFSYLFNMGTKDQADRVSLLTTSEKKQILNEEHLRIEVMNQELLLWRKQQELIVVNLTQGFKAHFGILDESFRARFEDVIK